MEFRNEALMVPK